jgi:hypothetical protein
MERAEQPGATRARRARWTAAGRSAHPDPSLAGSQAASVALSGRGEPGLLLVFASAAYDLLAIASGIADVAPDVPMVGCSTGGELAAAGPAERSVLVLALGGDELSFSTAAVAAADPRDAGARAAACLGDLEASEHRVLLLLIDREGARPEEIVRGAYSVAGAGVPLAGGVAGHLHGADPATSGVLHAGEVLRHAVVGVAIGSEAPLGVGVGHGRELVGEPMLVTRATPGRVLELDGRPAAEVYRERLGAHVSGFMADHPLGLRRRVGEAHLRSVLLDDAQDGGMACAVPAGTLVWMTGRARAGALHPGDAACDDALAALGGRAPQALIVFDCHARRAAVSPEAAHDEAMRLRERAGDGVLVGACTWGEIARARGSVGYHEQALAVLAIS